MAVTIQANASGNAGDASKWDDATTHALTVANASPPYMQITGDVAAVFTAGVLFTLSGNGDGLDGDYIVVSSNFDDPTTTIVLAAVANNGNDGTIKIHRVPVAGDVADINGKTIVQGGAFAAAEIQDVVTGGSFTIISAFDCLISGVRIIGLNRNYAA